MKEGIVVFCSRCGAQLGDGARFCASCGAPVEGAPAAQASPVAPSAPAAPAEAAPAAAAPVAAAPAPASESSAPANLSAAAGGSRRKGMRKMPFILLVALVMAALSGTAYAAYYVYTEVLPSQQEQPAAEAPQETVEVELGTVPSFATTNGKLYTAEGDEVAISAFDVDAQDAQTIGMCTEDLVLVRCNVGGEARYCYVHSDGSLAIDLQESLATLGDIVNVNEYGSFHGGRAVVLASYANPTLATSVEAIIDADGKAVVTAEDEGITEFDPDGYRDGVIGASETAAYRAVAFYDRDGNLLASQDTPGLAAAFAVEQTNPKAVVESAGMGYLYCPLISTSALYDYEGKQVFDAADALREADAFVDGYETEMVPTGADGVVLIHHAPASGMSKTTELLGESSGTYGLYCVETQKWLVEPVNERFDVAYAAEGVTLVAYEDRAGCVTNEGDWALDPEDSASTFGELEQGIEVSVLGDGWCLFRDGQFGTHWLLKVTEDGVRAVDCPVFDDQNFITVPDYEGSV